jgi:hypothetical protein
MSDNADPNVKPWYADIGDESLRGMAELKKFDTPEKALDAYVKLEKHIGVPPERLLKLPDAPDAPEWAAIHERLGFAAPADAKEYELTVPEGFNADYAAAVAAKAKELGIPKRMLQGLAEFNNTFVKTALDAEEKAQAQAHDAAMAELRVEWGGNFDTSIALSQRAEESIKTELGVGEDTLLAWQNADPKAYHKLLAYQASRMSEHQRVDGNAPQSTSAMSPEAARTRITQLAGDAEWFARWNNGDAAARKEWADLNAVAAKSGG